MNDWHVLDLGGNPAPGDPERTRALANRLLGQAELAEDNTRRLRQVSSSSGDLRMEGDYAPKFREALQDLPDELAKLGKAYRGCGRALSAFASSLEDAKTKAGKALRNGRDAYSQYQGAMRELRSVLPPDRQASFSTGIGPNDLLLESAIADLDEGAKTRARAAARRARFADGDRDRARRLAGEAARLRGEAETKCVSGINNALDDSGIKNKSFLEKAWDAVSKPFRSWDEFVKLCGKIAMVAGIVALFISGPIGWALLAASLVAGAVVFGDTLHKYANGKATLADVGLAALSLIPFKPGAVSIKALGQGLAGMTKAFASGQGGKLIGAGLRGMGRGLRNRATALPHALSNAGKVSGLKAKTEMFTRAFKCRYTGRDPIDMASGEMVMQQTDFELPGLLPVVLQRTHTSSYREGRWFGLAWTSMFDQRLEADGTEICMTAPDGVLMAYPNPQPGETVMAAKGPRLPLTRTDDGYVVTDADAGRTFHFPPLGDLEATEADPVLLPLAAISDRNGHRIDFRYDDAGLLTEIEHSGGYHLDVETTDGGLIAAFRLRGTGDEPDQELIRYGYDEGGNLTELINSSGQPLRFDYDSAGRMTRWLDRNGTEYRYTYDDAGRCVRTSGSAGCLDGTISYDPGNRVTIETNSLGHTTTYHFNEAVQIERVVNALGQATTNEWDAYDRLLSVTDPLGRTTRYNRDEAGNLVGIVRPDGIEITTSFNAMRLPTMTVGPDGAVWRREYDERGNLVTTIDPAGATTRYTYDEFGRPTAVTDALGQVRRMETNAAGQPLAVTDPMGATTRYEYNSAGRVAAVTDPVGGVTRFGWTVEGRLAWRALPDGATERWIYDAEGNLVEHVDAIGQVTRTESTHFDLPSARVTPDGARLEFAYDTELRLAAVTNPQGLVWRYDYDPAGNLVRETDFNGRVLTYRHDAAGQLVERVNGVGEITRYTRDLLGRAIERRSADSVTTFALDPAGRMVRAANPDVDLVFERDPLGRVLAETCNGRTVTSAYDALGRRVSRRTPSGAESAWEYDGNSHPVALHTAGQSIRFGYDAAGREVERRIGVETVLAQTWDANHQLLSQTLTAGGAVPAQPPSAREARLVQRRSYAYRPDGYVTAIDDHLSGGRRFDLDPIGRVTAVHGAGWTERYAYDAAGNITDAAWPAPPQADTLSADSQGQREYSGSLIRRAGDVRYEHDVQGRVTLRQQKRLSAKPRTWHYTWDADDRLVAVTTPDGQRWRYLYDPLGRRVAKQRLSDDGASVAEQVDFTWDGTVLAEQTHFGGVLGNGGVPGSRTTTWNWEPGGFRPVSQTERAPLRDAPQQWVDEQFYAIVTDLIGTPAELATSDGRIVWRSLNSLWGTPIAPASAGTDCPLGFPGQYADKETGLHYNYHRYYDSNNACFHSSDPLGLKPAPNHYTYVVNPFARVDPFGLSAYDPHLFRGSTEGYAGSANMQRVGVTPTTTDPAVATAFATESEQFGNSVVHIASPADVAGIERFPPSLGALENEVPLNMLPVEFAQRASHTIPTSQARQILDEMGIAVPRQITGKQDLDAWLHQRTDMTSPQIAEFVRRATGG